MCLCVCVCEGGASIVSIRWHQFNNLNLNYNLHSIIILNNMLLSLHTVLF